MIYDRAELERRGWRSVGGNGAEWHHPQIRRGPFQTPTVDAFESLCDARVRAALEEAAKKVEGWIPHSPLPITRETVAALLRALKPHEAEGVNP